MTNNAGDYLFKEFGWFENGGGDGVGVILAGGVGELCGEGGCID